MEISDYKLQLIDSVTAAAAKTADESSRALLNELAVRLQHIDPSDKYLIDACEAHGELPDKAQWRDALNIALAEYHSYPKAEQLPTIFLTDLIHAATPQEAFL